MILYPHNDQFQTKNSDNISKAYLKHFDILFQSHFFDFFSKEIKIFSDGFMRPPSITYSRKDDVVCEEFFKNSIQYSQNQNLTCFLNQKVYFF